MYVLSHVGQKVLVAVEDRKSWPLRKNRFADGIREIFDRGLGPAESFLDFFQYATYLDRVLGVDFLTPEDHGLGAGQTCEVYLTSLFTSTIDV